jgi:hypothetical protein
MAVHRLTREKATAKAINEHLSGTFPRRRICAALIRKHAVTDDHHLNIRGSLTIIVNSSTIARDFPSTAASDDRLPIMA